MRYPTVTAHDLTALKIQERAFSCGTVLRGRWSVSPRLRLFVDRQVNPFFDENRHMAALFPRHNAALAWAYPALRPLLQFTSVDHWHNERLIHNCIAIRNGLFRPPQALRNIGCPWTAVYSALPGENVGSWRDIADAVSSTATELGWTTGPKPDQREGWVICAKRSKWESRSSKCFKRDENVQIGRRKDDRDSNSKVDYTERQKRIEEATKTYGR